MRIPTLLLSFCLSWTVMWAQVKTEKNYPIEVSKPYKVEDGSIKMYFSEFDEIMAVKVRGRYITIQKFDSEKLRFLGAEKYEDMPDGFVVERIMEFGGRYWFFFSLWDKKKQYEQLYVREIDFAKGAFKGDEKRLIRIEGKITGSPIATFGLWGLGTVDKFDFFTSSDQSKMVVQYRKKPQVKKDAYSHDIIGLTVFDQTMTELWSKELRMPYTEKKMNNLDYSVDSEGNSYLLASVYDDNTTEEKDREGNPNYHIELFRIKANSAEIEITPIRIDDKFIKNIWIYERDNDEMVCAGFYNKGKDFSDADGIFMFNVTKEGTVSNAAFYEIPLEVLNQYVSSRSKKKNVKKDEKDKAEFDELKLREFIVQEDGGIILIGEQAYVVVRRYYSNGTWRTRTSYHYNDMLITKIDKNGGLAWMKKLPKRQVGSTGRGGMSYQYVNHLGDHTLLFLDNVKNMALPVTQIPSAHVDGAGGFLTGYRVNDDTGDITKISFLDTRNVDGMEVYQFRPSRILSISPVEFVVEVYKKKKEDVLIKVSLVK